MTSMFNIILLFFEKYEINRVYVVLRLVIKNNSKGTSDGGKILYIQTIIF